MFCFLFFVFPSGFFKAIALSRINTLQETLRLLSLLFKYGHHHEVNAAISVGIPTINIDTWLQVIPQLIARIYHSNADIRRLIHHLLTEIGKAHPQAVIYSLMVASKTQIENRKQAALEITDTLRMRSPILVQQVLQSNFIALYYLRYSTIRAILTALFEFRPY